MVFGGISIARFTRAVFDRGVKVRSQHGSRNGSRLRTSGPVLHLLFFGLSREQIRGLHIAIPGTPARDRPAAFDFDFQRVAGAFLRRRRRISQDVILGLLARDLLHAAEQVIRIHDYETAGALGQLIKHLLVIDDIWN